MNVTNPAQERSDLLAMLDGHWMTQAICAAATLGLPRLMARQPCDVGWLAQATETHAPSLLRLLRYLVSIGVMALRDDGSFQLTATGRLLDPAAPDSLHPWALLREARLPQGGQLQFSVRTGKVFTREKPGSDNFSPLATDAEAAAVFHLAMVAITRRVAAQVLQVLQFSPSESVLDVGGGSGELATALLKAHPTLRGTVFDLEHAREGALAHIADSGLGDRCNFLAGSFFNDMPQGYDVYLLKSVLHNWDDERAAAILARCRAAMAPSARLLIVERTLPERWAQCAEHRSVAASDLRMLVGLSGRERSENEFAALLCAATLRLNRTLALGGEFSCLEAVAG
jgi:orsellinic acid C2-O-methyltransferase